LSEFFPKSISVMTKMSEKERDEEQKWLNSVEEMERESQSVEKNATRFRYNEGAYDLLKAAKIYDAATR